jgi:hypothetical protein
MKNLYFLFLCEVLFACSPPKTILQTVDFKVQWDTTRVLKNPHKGWYHHLLDNGVDKYKIQNEQAFLKFPGMDHLYLRLAWSYLEPSEGQYDWHLIDEVVDKYVPLGYKISFRISSKETGTKPGTVAQEKDGVQYATPIWVANAGAKGKVIEVWGVKSWTPVWGDPVYLQKLDNFQRAFAVRYDGKEWVRYIDIGSIGEWGEGHTSFSTKIPPTVAEVRANIDVYLKNFKKSQLIVTDDLLYYGKSITDTKTLYDYAIANGVSLRDDSPLVDWYLQNNLKTWSVTNPEFYDPLYLTKPIVFELQHYGMVKKDGNWLGKNGAEKISKYGYSGAEVMRKAIETMHITYIGYHGYAEEWLADNPDLTNELANRCGYWYFPVSASFPSIIKQSENEITIEWLNKGIAPAYAEFGLVLRFESENFQNSFNLLPINSRNRDWMPGISKIEKYKLEIPANTQKGSYRLKFKLIEQSESNTILIQTGIKASLVDRDGFVEMGTIRIR